MGNCEELFSDTDSQSLIAGAMSGIRVSIDELTDDDLFAKDHQKLLEDLVVNHSIGVPVLKWDSRSLNQREVDIDLSKNPQQRLQRGLTGSYVVKGTEIEYRVPFEGDAEIFRCRPSSVATSQPQAEIEGDAIVIRVTRQDQNRAEYDKDFNKIAKEVQNAIDKLHSDFAGLEKALRETATKRLEERRIKRRKDRGLIDPN